MASTENKSGNKSKDTKDNGESTTKRNISLNNNDDPTKKKPKQSNAITPEGKPELEPYNVALFDDGTGFILNEKEVFWAKVVAMSSKNVMAKITTTRLKSVAMTMLIKHEKEYKNKTKDNIQEQKNQATKTNPVNAIVTEKISANQPVAKDAKVRNAKIIPRVDYFLQTASCIN